MSNFYKLPEYWPNEKPSRADEFFETNGYRDLSTVDLGLSQDDVELDLQALETLGFQAQELSNPHSVMELDPVDLARDYEACTPLWHHEEHEVYEDAIRALSEHGYNPYIGMSPGGWADLQKVLDGELDVSEMSFDGWTGYCEHWGDTWDKEYQDSMLDAFYREFDELPPESSHHLEDKYARMRFINRAASMRGLDHRAFTLEVAEGITPGLPTAEWNLIKDEFWDMYHGGYAVGEPNLLFDRAVERSGKEPELGLVDLSLTHEGPELSLDLDKVFDENTKDLEASADTVKARNTRTILNNVESGVSNPDYDFDEYDDSPDF